MYYPYLRGKQFELILLRDNADFIAENNINPIIEPVKSDFKALKRAFNVLNKNNVQCTLIVNPQVGRNRVKTSRIQKELIEESFKDYKNLSIGYILHAESEIADLISLIEKYDAFNFSIIHYGFTKAKELAKTIKIYDNIKTHIFIDGFAGKLYQRHLKNGTIKRILIRNGFKQQIKNSLYPVSEHFSDLHITYDDEGMDGFGDYLIVGDDYSETGGPAYAVAIHLTYLDNDDDMLIYHFISDNTDSPTDPGGKFLEALRKLVDKINNPRSLIFKSNAINDYLRLNEKKHYPGLGYLKKLSMQHHFELIADFIRRES
jgi:hypothetical protein